MLRHAAVFVLLATALPAQVIAVRAGRIAPVPDQAQPGVCPGSATVMCGGLE